MRVLIHDFAGHPFPVQLSRALAHRGYDVLHVYSQSIQTPKGNLSKKANDPLKFNIIGISQTKAFPKYSLIKRWFSERLYSKRLIQIVLNYCPEIVISANTPLEIQKDLLAYCKKKECYFIFWVQDIYSAAVKFVLKKKLPFLGSIFSFYYTFIEKRLLSKSDNIVVISEDFRSFFNNWLDHSRINVIENWAPLDEILPQSKVNRWSIKNGFSNKFCFVYAGTIGMKHNPAALLNIARQFKNEIETAIVIISEGIGIEWLKGQASKEKLKNIFFFNYLDFEQLPLALSSADVLIAILDQSAGEFCVPSKVLTYHCLGKPLLLSVPEENLVARIVKEQESGIVIDSTDIGGFCRAARRLRNDDRLRAKMGINARNYAVKSFNIDQKCNSFIKLFK